MFYGVRFILLASFMLTNAAFADEEPTALVTYDADVQPLLRAHCGRCHSAEGPDPGAPPFVDSYDEVVRPSGGRQASCPDVTVGECIAQAVKIQDSEGPWCRTFLRPFHRPGWICLDDAERALIATWIDDGMLEH